MPSPFKDIFDPATMASEIVAMGGSLDYAAMSAKKLETAFRRHAASVEILKKMRAEGKAGSAAFADQARKVRASASAVQKSAEASAKAANAQKDLKEAVKKNTTAYGKFATAVNTTSSALKKWLPLVGGSGLTLTGAKDALLKYNRSMYTLSRTFQATGRDAQDFTKAFKHIEQSTVMSKKQFVEFAQVAANSWKGVRPGIGAISELASAMQNQLGQNIDDVMDGLQSLMGIMDSFPALASRTADAIKGMQDGTTSKAQVEGLKSVYRTMLTTGQLSQKQFLAQMKQLNGVTGAQKKQVETNKKLANVSRNMEDGVLKMGQQIEPVLNKAADAMIEITDVIKQMPLAIAGVVAAFQVMSMAAGKANASILSGAMGKGGVGQMGKVLLGGGASKAVASGGGKASLGGIGKLGGGLLAGGIAGVREFSERKSSGQSTGEASAAGGINALGAGGGAMLGASIGTAVMPVVGTIIGGLIGGGIGAMLGESVSDSLIPEIKKAEEAQEELNDAMGKGADTAASHALALAAQRTQYEAINKLAQDNVSYAKTEIDILSGFGGIDIGNVDEVFGRLVGSLDRSVQLSREFMQSMATSGGFFEDLEKSGAKITPALKSAMQAASQGDFGKLMSQNIATDLTNAVLGSVQDINAKMVALTAKKSGVDPQSSESLKIQQEINALLVRRQDAESKLKQYGESRKNNLEGEAKKIEAIISASKTLADNAKKMNNVYQERLGLERDLMEAAQFGMGASLDMMQKQVDMAHELITLEKQRGNVLKHTTKEYLTQNGFTEQQAESVLETVKGAKSHMHAKQILNNLGIKEGKQQQAILQYSEQQQDVTKGIMQQQKKIYELTKEVREGYLDALTAMSVGFGEFEKIIGTQDMGTSQLMDFANKYTTSGEENVMNTMALGGTQTKGQTKAGIGGQITGAYSAVPGMPTLGFGGAGAEQARNSRISGYQKSQQDYYAMQQGRGGKDMGSAGAMTDAYGGALTAESVKDANKKGSTEGIVEGFKIVASRGGFNGGSNQNIMGGVNSAFRGGGRFNDPGNGRNAYSSSNFGGNLARNARGSGRADPSGYSRGGYIQGYDVPTDVYGTSPGLPTQHRDGSGVYYRGGNAPGIRSSGYGPKAGRTRNLSQPTVEQAKKNLDDIRKQNTIQGSSGDIDAAQKRVIAMQQMLKEAQNRKNQPDGPLNDKDRASIGGAFGVPALKRGWKLMGALSDQKNYNRQGLKKSFGDFVSQGRANSHSEMKAGRSAPITLGKAALKAGGHYLGKNTQASIDAEKAKISDPEEIRKGIEEAQKHLNKLTSSQISSSQGSGKELATAKSTLRKDQMKEIEALDKLELAKKAKDEEYGKFWKSVKKQLKVDKSLETQQKAYDEAKEKVKSSEKNVSKLTGKFHQDQSERVKAAQKAYAKAAERKKNAKPEPESKFVDLTEQEETMAAFSMRQQMGAMKGSSSEDIEKAMTSQFARAAAWETMTPEESSKERRRIAKASKMKYSKDSILSKASARGLQQQSFGKGFTSAAQKRGHEADAGMQAAFNSSQVQAEMQQHYGAAEGSVEGMAGGGGGGGTVQVVVSLSPDLRGQLSHHGNVIAELNNASANKQ